MLVARGLMYSAVYFHRVTRVTEVMLSRAVERAGDNLPDSLDLQRRVDAEIWAELDKVGGFSRDMVTRLKYRNLPESLPKQEEGRYDPRAGRKAGKGGQ
ncbi:MAG: hypothetical protein Ct9H90mP24_7930 [Methanobacteriota archaeon]|nr:MAG: hypothetical protein Ct9H90mP24_7930 [Euryarchaeota archaeon]